MIVEMFGPAGSGKTTLAKALTLSLRAGGVPARFIGSERPAERDVSGSGRQAAMSRAGKFIDILGIPGRTPERSQLADDLLHLFPPRNPLWGLRYRRYLAGLDTSWRQTQGATDLVIFDQGYLCALCSLIILAPRSDPHRTADALDLLPRPDLLIRIGASKTLLASRLSARIERQSLLERMFEMRPQVSIRQVDVVASIADLLADRGRRPIHVESHHDLNPDSIAARIANEIVASRQEASICAR